MPKSVPSDEEFLPDRGVVLVRSSEAPVSGGQGLGVGHFGEAGVVWPLGGPRNFEVGDEVHRLCPEQNRQVFSVVDMFNDAHGLNAKLFYIIR